MNAYHLRYKLIADFTPLELGFRYIYDHNMDPAQALNSVTSDPYLYGILNAYPEDLKAFRNILKHIEEGESLDDEIFFQGNEDIYMNMHSRYMPAYPHKHKFFELQYVLSGTLKQKVAGHELTLRAGDMCFIAPETTHEISVFDEDTLVANILIKVDTFRSVFMNLLNKDDIISDFFSRVLMCNSYYPYIYCRTEIEKTLTEIVLSMFSIRDSEIRLKNRLLINKLEEMFIYLLNNHEYDFITGSSIGETDKKMLPILRYIQEHYKTTSLADISRYFNYSEAYMSRIITLYSGSGFSQILKSTRLKNAAKLLIDSELSIEEISEECGYDERTYFHKAFKKQYGMTPVQFRKEHTRKTNQG